MAGATSISYWLSPEDLPYPMHAFAEIDISFLYACMCLRSCLGIRQSDGPNRDGKLFAVTYPVASIVGSMLVCMGGSTLLSLFLGMPLQGFKSDFGFWLSVGSWYLANHSPYDFVWKLWGNKLFQLVLFITAENRKLRNVMTGMQLTQDVYPGAFSAWIIGSVLYACGSVFMKTLEELLRGKPKTNEIRNPSPMTKVAFHVSFLYAATLSGLLPIHPKAAVIVCTCLVIPLAIGRYLSGRDLDPFYQYETVVRSIVIGPGDSEADSAPMKPPVRTIASPFEGSPGPKASGKKNKNQ